MCTVRFTISLILPVVFGWAMLVAGSGCGGSASTSTPARTTPIDAVREVFPSATEVAERSMDKEADSSGLAGRAAVSEIRGPSGLLGYLIATKVSGRSGPFGITVFLDERLIVKRATVASYPWPRGREVRRRSFTSQFEGKGPGDAIEVGKDIDAVTGATISCQAMARGVRDAVRRLAE